MQKGETRIQHLAAMAVGALLLALSQSTFAVAEIDTDAGGVALKGHDPVAYFTVGKTVKGSAEHSVQHNGATYHFSSGENAEAFTADPEKFSPKYGGYCAFGTTFGKKVPGDPQAWEIVEGTLYINSSPDVHTRWSKDVPGNIGKADGIWGDIQDKDPKDL